MDISSQEIEAIVRQVLAGMGPGSPGVVDDSLGGVGGGGDGADHAEGGVLLQHQAGVAADGVGGRPPPPWRRQARGTGGSLRTWTARSRPPGRPSGTGRPTTGWRTASGGFGVGGAWGGLGSGLRGWLLLPGQGGQGLAGLDQPGGPGQGGGPAGLGVPLQAGGPPAGGGSHPPLRPGPRGGVEQWRYVRLAGTGRTPAWPGGGR